MTCSSAGGPLVKMFAGNLLPTYFADARTCDGPFDFTDWTLTFEMRGPVIVTGAAAGDDQGVLSHSWIAGETDAPGDYEVIFHGVSPAPESKPQTFLVSGTLRIMQV